MNGRILGIKIGDTFVPCEMSCDISIDGERINTSSSENGNWRNSIAGYRSWKASVNGKFQLDASEGSEAGSLGLIQAIIDGNNVELVMTLRIDSTQSLLIGGIAGTTNISISAGSTGDATWSGNFDGVGLLDLDYNFGAGYLRDNDGDKIVDSEGFGILLAEGDINFPNGVSQVPPAGTKILVADTNDEIAWVNPADISENSYTTADKNKLALMTAIFTTALKNAYDGAVTWISTNGSALIAHLTRTDNPHSVTKTQVGLSNVSNTAPADLPISNATQTALEGKLSDITGLIEQGTNVTISGSGTDEDPYVISSSGGGGGGGGVDSVGLTAPTGFEVGNTPITSSGNIALTFATGYSLPTNAKQTSWDAKQDALGFTPENVVNKATNLTSPDDTKYPTTKATVDALATKAPLASPIFTGFPEIPSNTQPLSVLSQSGATTDQSVKWNGSAWVPYTPSGGGGGSLSGSVTVSFVFSGTRSTTATVSGAAIGDTVDFPLGAFRRSGGSTNQSYILSGVVTALNTVTIYASFIPGGAAPTDVPIETNPITIDFKVRK